MIKVLLVALLWLPVVANAYDKYDMCELNGYFSGYQDLFFGRLTAVENAKSGFKNDGKCRTLFSNGYRVGKLMLQPKGAGVNVSDGAVGMKAQVFQDKVLMSILKTSATNMN